MNPRHRVLMDNTPNARAARLALQAGNYARSIRAGVKHDPREVESLVQEAQGLLDAITEDVPKPDPDLAKLPCACGSPEDTGIAHFPKVMSVTKGSCWTLGTPEASVGIAWMSAACPGMALCTGDNCREHLYDQED